MVANDACNIRKLKKMWISKHPQEDLAKFGYRSIYIYIYIYIYIIYFLFYFFIFKKPQYVLATCKNMWTSLSIRVRVFQLVC